MLSLSSKILSQLSALRRLLWHIVVGLMDLVLAIQLTNAGARRTDETQVIAYKAFQQHRTCRNDDQDEGQMLGRRIAGTRCLTIDSTQGHDPCMDGDGK